MLLRKKKISKHITDGIKVSSDTDTENSDEENFNKESSNVENSDKENLKNILI